MAGYMQLVALLTQPWEQHAWDEVWALAPWLKKLLQPAAIAAIRPSVHKSAQSLRTLSRLMRPTSAALAASFADARLRSRAVRKAVHVVAPRAGEKLLSAALAARAGNLARATVPMVLAPNVAALIAVALLEQGVAAALRSKIRQEFTHGAAALLGLAPAPISDLPVEASVGWAAVLVQCLVYLMLAAVLLVPPIAYAASAARSKWAYTGPMLAPVPITIPTFLLRPALSCDELTVTSPGSNETDDESDAPNDTAEEEEEETPIAHAKPPAIPSKPRSIAAEHQTPWRSETPIAQAEPPVPPSNPRSIAADHQAPWRSMDPRCTASVTPRTRKSAERERNYFNEKADGLLLLAPVVTRPTDAASSGAGSNPTRVDASSPGTECRDPVAAPATPQREQPAGRGKQAVGLRTPTPRGMRARRDDGESDPAVRLYTHM